MSHPLGKLALDQSPSDFDFRIEGVQKDGDRFLLHYENLDDAKEAFEELAESGAAKRAQLIDNRSGNLLDEFEEEKSFPWLMVLGLGAAGVGAWWLLKQRDRAQPDGIAGLLGGGCGCSG